MSECPTQSSSYNNGESKTSKKMRSTNIELCRIICMILIIMHHYVIHGGAYAMDWCDNKYIALFFVPFGKIAFDCFIAVSAFFLVDQLFKTKRFILTWLEVLFYSIVFAIVSYSYGVHMESYNWFSVCLPILGNSHGFAASYLLFYLLTPFLYKINKAINKRQLLILIFLLTLAEVISKIIGCIDYYTQPFASELFVFILIYFVISYLKKYPFEIKHNVIVPLLIFSICFVYTYIVWILLYTPSISLHPAVYQLCSDESSITNIVGGIALFFVFKNIKIKNSRIINYIAGCTFAVLLIHDHNFFRNVLWHDILHVENYYYSEYFILNLIIVSLSIFVICVCIEILRKELLEKKIVLNNGYINKICTKMDSIILDT